MSGHTPGPYEVRDETDLNGSLWIVAHDRDGNERSIAEVRDGQRSGFETGPQSPETLANAALFAAAPAMLEALRKANTCASIPDYVQELIRDAINKATNQSTK